METGAAQVVYMPEAHMPRNKERFDMYKTVVGIDGMSCGMCEAHINDAIRRAFAVKKVTSSHKKNLTEILSETPISEDELRKAIEPTGYGVVSVSSEEYVKKGLFGR